MQRCLALGIVTVRELQLKLKQNVLLYHTGENLGGYLEAPFAMQTQGFYLEGILFSMAERGDGDDGREVTVPPNALVWPLLRVGP